MPIETNVIIDLIRNTVIIPPVTLAVIGTRLRFIVRVKSDKLNDWQGVNRVKKLKLYFEKDPPEGFKKVSELVVPEGYSNQRDTPVDLILSDGVVATTGHFKYGVSGSSVEGQELFDEDPFLIIYP